LEVVLRAGLGRDSRGSYRGSGEASWRKGALTLPEGSRLSRSLEAGATVEITARLRLPAGQDDVRFELALTEGKRTLRLELIRAGGRWRLRQQGFAAAHEVELPADLSLQPAGGGSLRWQLSWGFARARVWPAGRDEPGFWQATCLPVNRDWRPTGLAVAARAGHGWVLTAWAVQGEAPLRLTAQQQELLQQAEALH